MTFLLILTLATGLGNSQPVDNYLAHPGKLISWRTVPGTECHAHSTIDEIRADCEENIYCLGFDTAADGTPRCLLRSIDQDYMTDNDAVITYEKLVRKLFHYTMRSGQDYADHLSCSARSIQEIKDDCLAEEECVGFTVNAEGKPLCTKKSLQTPLDTTDTIFYEKIPYRRECSPQLHVGSALERKSDAVHETSMGKRGFVVYPQTDPEKFWKIDSNIPLVYEFDMLTNTEKHVFGNMSSKGPSITTATQPIRHFHMGMLGDELYVYGGKAATETAGMVRLHTLWKFSFLNFAWEFLGGDVQGNVHSTLSPVLWPGARDHVAGCMFENRKKFYVYGGHGYTTSGGQGALSELWSYDTVAGAWALDSGDGDTRQARDIALGIPGTRVDTELFCDEARNRVVMVGGEIAWANTDMNDVWAFYPDNSSWVFFGGDERPWAELWQQPPCVSDREDWPSGFTLAQTVHSKPKSIAFFDLRAQMQHWALYLDTLTWELVANYNITEFPSFVYPPMNYPGLFTLASGNDGTIYGFGREAYDMQGDPYRRKDVWRLCGEQHKTAQVVVGLQEKQQVENEMFLGLIPEEDVLMFSAAAGGLVAVGLFIGCLLSKGRSNASAGSGRGRRIREGRGGRTDRRGKGKSKRKKRR